MEKFILRFNHFNKIYWRKAEQNKPRLLTTRSMGKTMIVQAHFETLCRNYSLCHKSFITKFEKIDKWRKKHKIKGL